MAPPAFLRTLKHGAAVMLTGNTPPALVSTHAYYEEHRWRRLVNDGELKRHAEMHSGAGPTTARQWEDKDWPGNPPEPRTPRGHRAARRNANGNPHVDRGSLGASLAADYPPVHCNRDIRRRFGPGGRAIPDQLRGDPGRWTTVHLPEELADDLGIQGVDLADPHDRRRVLPHLLEVGPADLVACVLTFPQLRAEWHHLELTDALRQGWEACYPALGADIDWHHPSIGPVADL